MLKGILGTLRKAHLHALLAGVIATSAFAVASVEASDMGFRCCTKETDCRHVDNQKECTDNPACANNGDYKFCCGDAICTRTEEEGEMQ